ncbi:class I SAM-dependent methyltransferase [Solimicrobium silvestre]|uniref:Putative methyltransferase n=1 Tax=Solimicrobium silvestre TaxID=2099400 RepID=A0A2S9H1H0_9BURK|nr:methyltransferase [Solimicrobium silvestre]PRC93831.1 putative methyltransferase [Solimicrobium silvestre]
MKRFPSMRLLPTLLTALLCLGFSQTVLADEALQTAIDGAHRSDVNKSRDAARHPKEVLQFFGITPTMTVVELMPGAGWYTEILAPYLKPQGQLIEALQDPVSESEYGRNSYAKFQKKLNDNPAVFDKVKTAIFEPPVKLNFAPNNSVDMVLTFRNIHNWAISGDENMKQLFKHVYSSLKTGGVFGVVDHRLPAGKVQDANASTGYVSEAYVIKLAESVGFKLVAKSEINANPKDTADHKGGVWALPPTYANKDADRQSYADIGESDRMTLKFVK